MADSTQPVNPSPGLIYRKSDYPGVFARIGPINYLVDMFWLYGESPR